MRPLIYMIGAAAERPPYKARLAWDAEFFNLQKNEDYYPDGVRNPFGWVPDEAYQDGQLDYRATINGEFLPVDDGGGYFVNVGKGYNQAGMLLPANPNMQPTAERPNLRIEMGFSLNEGMTVTAGHSYTIFALNQDGQTSPLLQATARMAASGNEYFVGFKVLDKNGDLKDAFEIQTPYVFKDVIHLSCVLSPTALEAAMLSSQIMQFPVERFPVAGRRTMTLFDSHGQYDIDYARLSYLSIEPTA